MKFNFNDVKKKITSGLLWKSFLVEKSLFYIPFFVDLLLLSFLLIISLIENFLIVLFFNKELGGLANLSWNLFLSKNFNFSNTLFNSHVSVYLLLFVVFFMFLSYLSVLVSWYFKYRIFAKKNKKFSVKNVLKYVWFELRIDLFVFFLVFVLGVFYRGLRTFNSLLSNILVAVFLFLFYSFISEFMNFARFYYFFANKKKIVLKDIFDMISYSSFYSLLSVFLVFGVVIFILSFFKLWFIFFFIFLILMEWMRVYYFVRFKKKYSIRR